VGEKNTLPLIETFEMQNSCTDVSIVGRISEQDWLGFHTNALGL